MNLVAVLFAVVACSTKQKADGVIPAEPNYEESSQWYITDRQGEADIFYIISTETGDYPSADGSMCHYADTYADSLRLPMLSEMEGVDTLLSGKLNFYTPYYRQCSLQSFMSDSLASKRMQLSIADVRRSFAYYLKYMNQGRPFILCGFSQGALIALELMREMDDETYRRARHVITEDDRVLEASKAFEAGDLKTLAKLMYASHISEKNDFEITVKETDAIVDIVKEALGEEYAAVRQTGGGFGGCVVAVVEPKNVEVVKNAINAKYQKISGIGATIFETQACDGATFTRL